MTDYETRTLSLIVKPASEPVFSEYATTVSIADEAGGPFVEVTQRGRELGKVAISPGEWPHLRAAIDRMIAECATMEANHVTG